jgi:Na+/melibiose symporter-like transporter
MSAAPAVDHRMRGFVALLVAEAISIAGTSMSRLALPWLVLSTTGDAVSTGLVGFAELAPFAVLKVVGAPFVDRIGGKRAAVGGNLVAAVAMVTVPVLWATGVLGLGVMLGLVFLAGLARGPADTATQVILPAVTEQAGVSINRGVAIYDGASRTAKLVRAPAGAALIGIMGPANVVIIDAASFLAAAVLVAAGISAAAGRTSQTEPEAGPEGYLARLGEGLGYLVRQPLLRSMAGLVLVTNFADAAMSGLLLIIWGKQRYGGTAQIGVVAAVFGAGAVAGATLLSWIGGKLPRRRIFAAAFLIAGAPRFAILAVHAPIWLVLTVWAVCLQPRLRQRPPESIWRTLEQHPRSVVRRSD